MSASIIQDVQLYVKRHIGDFHSAKLANLSKLEKGHGSQKSLSFPSQEHGKGE